jgi:rhodanese-related sulfurtransferase
MQRRRMFAYGAALCSPFAWAQPISQVVSANEQISLEEARRLHESGAAVLIDIREPQEHASGVAAGAKLLPMSQISKRLAEIPTDSSKPVLLICSTQNRSSTTLRALRAQISFEKYAHVRYVHGGMSDWAKRGWPMVKP